ncbi:MAG TPA: phage tail protein [Blastocatellia bacterium]|nr:phage tail protein [Blastocatellia bacterium]
MPAPRAFALIRTQDQWLRVSHNKTALQGEVVQLFWRDEKPQTAGDHKPCLEAGAGLAFDDSCRLYHSAPKEGRVERFLWAAHDPLEPSASQPVPVDLFQTDIDRQLGDFILAGEAPTALAEPRGLAVSEDDRLFIAEAGANRILIYDLRSNRLLRRVQLAASPVDLAAEGRTVFALLTSPPGLIKLDARTDPRTLPLPAQITAPSRIALAPSGEIYILEQAGTAQARVVKYDSPAEAIEVNFATDIEFQVGDSLVASACAGNNHVLVVARRPQEDFLRFCVGEDGVAELPPLKARGYDGLGIVLAPDGRIGFWTDKGFRHTVAARLRYFPEGSITTFRLDSGEFNTIWGRIFFDACIPKDTRVVVRCIADDEPPEEAAIERKHPANTNDDPPHADLSPPMPPVTLAHRLVNAPPQTLHMRETGRELPWVRPAEDDPFETYEAPVIAEPGRYLWVHVELSGNTRSTPRIKALRAEYPTHDYLRRLPQTYSREERMAAFLRRYLAIFEGALGEFESKADARAALLDPRSAPQEILPWLATFVGMTFDERMARAPRPGGQTEDVRRTLIREATWLFRFRGTVPGLRRFLEIYLGHSVMLIEKYRVRGLGGAVLGDPSGLTSSSVLGAGFRIGGAIGLTDTQTLTGTVDDAFDTHAHRFAVIIPSSLTSDQQEVVRQILELHRPAHTLVEVCTVAAGMRVGRGLHVELTSIIGRGGGFTQLQLGNSQLGRGNILGIPEAGTVLSSARVGRDSRVG